MRIIHISDLHFGSSKINSQSIHLSTSKLVELILDHYKNDADKPLILLTGDIIASPFPQKKSRKVFYQLKKLKDAGHELLICPGNHDLKGSGFLPSFKGKRKFNSVFKSLLPRGTNRRGDAANNFYTYPMTHSFGDFFFIGLDSMLAQKIAGAKGEIGDAQLEKLKALISAIKKEKSNPKISIYLHNSPFTTIKSLKLIDSDKLMKTISGVNGLFFGHHHQTDRYPKEEKKHSIDCIVNSGASTLGRRKWTEINLSNFTSQVLPKK